MNFERAQALAELICALRAVNYHFITPTPLTHARVLKRKSMARDLRDVFGWSLPFTPDAATENIVGLMRDADVLDTSGPHFKSRVRVSSLGDDLLLHSAYPTTQHDSVFFGPDSYRFANFIRAELPTLERAHRGPIDHLVDIGSGAGAGAIAASECAEINLLSLTDINPTALELARANVTHAWPSRAYRPKAKFIECNALDKIDTANVIVANPPYIVDDTHRAYRDGGGMHGAEISLVWAKAAAEKLISGGALLLYTGSAIVDGEDRFKAALLDALPNFDIAYRELDPDVFGEELERDVYADVERIAVVGVVAVKR